MHPNHHFPPPPTTTTTIITTLIFFTLLLLPYTTSHPCSSYTTTCPPFTTTTPPPYPFSTSPGCGHPSFQIHCSNTSRATIIINNLNFSLLTYLPNSTSLILSPLPPTTTTTHNCTSPHSFSIPPHPINLSASPFRVSDSACSRLSVLKPCPPPNLPNCSHCPWQCKLIKTPLHLVHDCPTTTTPRQVSPQGCQSDILEFLDRFLKLGIEIEWDEEEKDSYFTNCKACQSKNGVCGFNSTDPNKQFICFGSSYQNTMPPLIRQKSPNRIAVLCITFLFIFFLLAVLISLLISRSRRKSLSLLQDPALLYLHRHRSASLLPPVFTFEELQLSTNNFDTKRKIGDGGFGVVFLGQLYDNSIVAVKYLHRQIPATKSGTQSAKSFCNEILILSSINHPNLVKLHGYCSDPRGLILVYEYVANGTLAEHLHGSKSFHRKGVLTWQIRINIALQIAVAMEYLHFLVVPPIVHRDITSNNIFVERDMRVKVGDFGLSRLLVCSEAATTMPRGDSDCVWTGPQGTPGYLDPDYHKSFRLTEKSDVYSFGVVLLELVTGMRAVDHRREKREMALADMVVSRIHMGLLKEVVDPVLAADKEAMEGVGAVAELAFRCVAVDKDDRPDAREVVAELRSIRGRTGGVRVSNSGGNVVVPESGSL